MAFMEGCPQGLYYGVVPLYATKYYAYSGADPGGVDWVSSTLSTRMIKHAIGKLC